MMSMSLRIPIVFAVLITDKAIRRGSFDSVKQLIRRIDQFVSHYNENWAAPIVLAGQACMCKRSIN
ncbi:hypothetical protein R54767_04021 [Paraburkholderia gardini]|uniref:Uncharacterized protein n=2 Tax=Paraburkholderia gardini TaxID=2823469 RepID=A0ABN7QU19_9BURK|nr:hypothetical protein R54767_04021 [Paraburkholderia gardini]